ncbi:peptidoglycan-binding protein [Ruminiclostridium papyrosolvens]|uniref:Peptidoglycan-binding protein n=1 Tax=Ruminiclostridium papyrosolvens C7 TaxID=1330534 RepID=U4R2V0_9FIRM|nr:peptidoglycan-binding protein [Ruminiclostridium papyrosolvens]EPR11929.1 peptidoglycan-binding protein [Ruminiclostridium papyrosolvens C7]
MNLKKIKSLISDIPKKIKNYKNKYPSKYKYIIISCSGAAALALTAAIVFTLPPSSSKFVAADKQESTASISSQTTPQKYSKSESESTALTKTSRGITPMNPKQGDVIKSGVKDSTVTVIQKRLMDLDYLEIDEPTDEFGEPLQFAIELFQRKNKLPITGEVDAKTYELLLSEDAKAYTVSLEAEGTDVQQLQERLYELGYINKATGYFGTDTDTAVKEFQKRNGLYDDGNVGKQTREILYSTKAVPMSFYLGDENSEILQFKQRLYELGYLTAKPSGKYDNDTVLAVKRFQENNGLIADGFIGPVTKDLLMSADATENALDIGDSGDDVTKVQTYLKKLGYLKGVTGYFGSDTHNAVLNFQTRNGLGQDGKVGSQTIAKLLSPDARKWTGGSGSGSNGNNSGGSSNSGGGNNSGGESNGGNFVSPSVERLISVAKSKLGSRYVYGAKGPNTFDCSGFVYWVLKNSGVRQGYMTSGGWAGNGRYKRISSMSSIKRGDIITYNGHVGIALGGNQMIDASSSQGRVRITNITSSYWTRNFVCAFRIF